MNHEFYMNRCIELAKKAEGNTYPNPMVGCVIVHENRIVGEGYHHKAGEPHAEIMAINSVRNAGIVPECDIYVSLEPCAHYGKTPPCALKLKETGFKKVIIGTVDSHEKVKGKGIQILEDAKIPVIKGVAENECIELNRRFFTFHQKKRPYLLLKWAQSGDGFMDKNFKPFQIGNPLTKQFVHHLRSTEHAIMVGTATALNDNPTLTTREISGRNPIRIVIDFALKIPRTHHIFNDDAKTVVINANKNKVENNIEFRTVSRENFLEDLMSQLFEMQIQSVLVEGGSATLSHLLENDLWDEAIIIKNPELNLKSGTKAPHLQAEPVKICDFGGNSVEFYRNGHSIL